MVLVHTALKWFHSFVPNDGRNPLDNACCKNLIECAKRTRSSPVYKKKPVDPTIIRSIIDRHGLEEASVKDLRIAAIFSLGFGESFRFNELSNIQPKHLVFCIGFVKIFVAWSKTDVYREDNYVDIAKLEGKYCPVAVIRWYIEAANLDLSSNLPLFRPSTKTKLGYSLRLLWKIWDTTPKIMAYIVCVLGVLWLLSLLTIVSETLLKLHGRWKTDEAKDMYVLESESNRLSVTRYLGIWSYSSYLKCYRFFPSPMLWDCFSLSLRARTW